MVVCYAGRLFGGVFLVWRSAVYRHCTHIGFYGLEEVNWAAKCPLPPPAKIKTTCPMCGADKATLRPSLIGLCGQKEMAHSVL